MNERKTELLVGLFAIAIFAVLTFMTFKVGEFSIGKKQGYVVYAYFKDTAGLYEQTKVKVAGVDAGTLENIGLVNGVARLTLRIDPDVVLYSDASAGIRTTGLLGDKFLELKVGHNEPVLKDGDTLLNVEEFADIDSMMQNLSTLSSNMTELVSSINQPDTREALRESVLNLRDITETLKTVVSGNEERLDRILTKVDSLTTALNEMVVSSKDPLNNTLTNLEDFSGSLKEQGPQLVSDLSETVSELKSVIHDNRSELDNLILKSSATMNSVSSVANTVDKGEGTIGKLVHDDKLYYAITNAVGGVSNTLAAINRFKTFITFRGDYLTRENEARGGFYVTLQPKEDKYYILGVVRDPVSSVEVTDTYVDGVHTHEEKVNNDLEFTAQFAKRFNDTALRIGIVQNSFGLGVDQFFLDDKLRLYADVWDLGADEYLADNAHLSLGADYFLFKHLFVSGGVDNLLNSHRTGAFFGGGVRFEDEDFKYLFGAGLPNVSK